MAFYGRPYSGASGGLIPAGYAELLALPGKYLNQAITSFGSEVGSALEKYAQNKEDEAKLRGQMAGEIAAMDNGSPSQVAPAAIEKFSAPQAQGFDAPSLALQQSQPSADGMQDLSAPLPSSDPHGGLIQQYQQTNNDYQNAESAIAQNIQPFLSQTGATDKAGQTQGMANLDRITGIPNFAQKIAKGDLNRRDTMAAAFAIQSYNNAIAKQREAALQAEQIAAAKYANSYTRATQADAIAKAAAEARQAGFTAEESALKLNSLRNPAPIPPGLDPYEYSRTNPDGSTVKYQKKQNLSVQTVPDPAGAEDVRVVVDNEGKPVHFIQTGKTEQQDETAVQNFAEYERQIADLEKAIDRSGTWESRMGNAEDAASLAALPYKAAITYAKIVDPASVAREGEVEAAKKYLIPLGLWASKDVALAAIKNQREEIRRRKADFEKIKGMKTLNVTPQTPVAGSGVVRNIVFTPGGKLTFN